MAPSVSCGGPVLHGDVTASRARAGLPAMARWWGRRKRTTATPTRAHGGVASLVLHERSVGPGAGLLRLAERVRVAC